MNVHDKVFYFFKVDPVQRTGSFSFRGALNAIQYQLSVAGNTTALAVVTHSSGNHAQALALAAQAASTDETRESHNCYAKRSTCH
jgi:threonine dehydratase